MCESDEIIQHELEEEDKNVSADINEKEKELIPAQFKSVHGKAVRVVGAQRSRSLVLISYSSSKLQGNALINANIESPTELLSDVELLYDEGFLEDDKGDENDSLILPIDAIDLSDELHGVVVDCDLRKYTKGFSWMLNANCGMSPKKIPYVSILNTIINLVKALIHLNNKGVYWKAIDGHNFFFNAEYGAFRLVYDGIDIVKQEDIDLSDYVNQLNKSISAIIMFSLVGAWPDSDDSGLLKYPVLNPNIASWDSETDDLVGNTETMEAWKAMPSIIKEAITNTCFSNSSKIVTLDDWVKLLQDSINEVDICVFCGGDVFKTATHCLCCGNTTRKDSLFTKWSIQAGQQIGNIRLSFGRGVIVPGEFLGLSTRFTPFMRIMYNSKSNTLGIKNISSIKWTITKSEISEVLSPGSIAPIETDMSIEFEGHPDIIMSFMGYER